MLIIVSVIFGLPFVRSGGGVILVVGLVYSYVVAKREFALLAYAVESHNEEDPT